MILVQKSKMWLQHTSFALKTKLLRWKESLMFFIFSAIKVVENMQKINLHKAMALFLTKHFLHNCYCHT